MRRNTPFKKRLSLPVNFETTPDTDFLRSNISIKNLSKQTFENPNDSSSGSIEIEKPLPLLPFFEASEIMPTPSVIGSSKASTVFRDLSLTIGSLEDYKRILVEEADLSEFKDDMSFSGFDKEKIAKMAAKKLGPYRTVKMVFLAAMRGTNLTKICSKSVNLDSDVAKIVKDNLVLSNGRGPDDLTMGRLLATFPEVAAYYMMKYRVPKKLVASQCPASLQFPAAAALPMKGELRREHVRFSMDFHKLINPKNPYDPVYYRAAFGGMVPVKDIDGGFLSTVLGDVTDVEAKAVGVDELLDAEMRLRKWI